MDQEAVEVLTGIGQNARSAVIAQLRRRKYAVDSSRHGDGENVGHLRLAPQQGRADFTVAGMRSHDSKSDQEILADAGVRGTVHTTASGARFEIEVALPRGYYFRRAVRWWFAVFQSLAVVAFALVLLWSIVHLTCDYMGWLLPHEKAYELLVGGVARLWALWQSGS